MYVDLTIFNRNIQFVPGSFSLSHFLTRDIKVFEFARCKCRIKKLVILNLLLYIYYI